MKTGIEFVVVKYGTIQEAHSNWMFQKRRTWGEIDPILDNFFGAMTSDQRIELVFPAELEESDAS